MTVQRIDAGQIAIILIHLKTYHQ